jgi:hypothetical protein
VTKKKIIIENQRKRFIFFYTCVNESGATAEGQNTFCRVCGLSIFHIATSLLP